MPRAVENPLYDEERRFENPFYEGADHTSPVAVQQETVEHNPLENLLAELKSSKKGGIGSENSSKFTAVVNLLTDIQGCWNYSLSARGQVNYQLLNYTYHKYQQLLAACDEYLDRQLVLTADGRQRQNMVQQVLEFASRDMEALMSASTQVLNGADTQVPTIGDLLARGRMLQFTVENINEDVGGANSSIVHKLEYNGQKYFFKKEENVLTLNEETLYDREAAAQYYFNPAFQAALDNIPDGPGSKKLRQHLLAIKIPFQDRTLQPISSDEEWLKEIQDMFEEVGKPCPPEKELKEMLPVVASIHKAAKAKHTTSFNLFSIGIQQSPEGPSEVNVSKRNVATSRMAELLGVGHLVARSETAEVTDAATGEKYRGNLMAKAVGSESTAVEKMAKERNSAEMTSGGFQRATICLQMLDNICSQVDRHDQNMMYQIHNGVITGIQGIDNDLAFGESDLLTAGTTANAKSSFNEGEAGLTLSIPYMDKTMARNIIELAKRPEVVRFVMSDVLRPVEIDALIDRLTTAANVLQAAMQEESGKSFEQGRQFLEADEWDQYKDQIHANLLQKAADRSAATYYSRFMSHMDKLHRSAQKEKKKAT